MFQFELILLVHKHIISRSFKCRECLNYRTNGHELRSWFFIILKDNWECWKDECYVESNEQSNLSVWSWSFILRWIHLTTKGNKVPGNWKATFIQLGFNPFNLFEGSSFRYSFKGRGSIFEKCSPIKVLTVSCQTHCFFKHCFKKTGL